MTPIYCLLLASDQPLLFQCLPSINILAHMISGRYRRKLPQTSYGRRSLPIGRPQSQQQHDLLKDSYDENAANQLKPQFKASPRCQVMTAKSSRTERLLPRSVDCKRQTMILHSPEMNQESRIERLGLDAYIKNMITGGKGSNDVVIKTLNQTWINPQEKNMPHNDFHSSMGGRKSSKSLNQQPTIDWTSGKQEETNWKEMNRISHYLFPCRKQTRLLKDRFYANQSKSKEKPLNQSNLAFNSEFAESMANVKVTDITGNVNKLLKRLVGNQTQSRKGKSEAKINKIRRISVNIVNQPSSNPFLEEVLKGRRADFHF